MKFVFNFEIEKDKLATLVKNVRKVWIREKLIKLDPDFQKFNEEIKYSYLLVFAAIGFFESGFDEEKTLQTLKDILETEEPSVPAPGNDKIH